MSDLQPIPFGLQSYGPRSPALRIELAENLYAEKGPEGTKGSVVLLGTPGLRLRATVGEGPIRGMRKLNNLLYVVSGDKLYSITKAGVVTELGGIDGSGPVSIINNATQLAITTSGPAYYFSDGVVGSLPESDLSSATYQDGYGLYTQRNTERVFWSGIDDLTILNALDRTSVDALPDKVVGLISDHREVWVFGEETIEVLVNTGSSAGPFVRTGGGFIEHGCASAKSIAKAENMVFWLSNDGRVYSAQGYSAQPISTPAIEYEIAQEPSKDSSTAFTYTQEGHTFYVLSFAGRTLVFDITTGLWHKRKTYGLNRWRVDNLEPVWNVLIVGDYSSGNIYELDLETYTDHDSPIVRSTVSPPLYAGGKRLVFDEMLVDIEAGVGQVSGPGSNPKIYLDWTADYGRTYSHDRERSFGRVGEYKKQVRYFNLGSFRNRSYRLRVSDPVPVRILGVYGRMETVEA